MPKRGVPIEALQRVPLFAGLSKRHIQQVARLFKERRFSEGETVIQEGSGGAAFFVIESGEATVSIGGKKKTTLKPDDFFGEIALIDGGTRMATITASMNSSVTGSLIGTSARWCRRTARSAGSFCRGWRKCFAPHGKASAKLRKLA